MKDPQREQVYGNQHGKPLGRPGNGLGDVYGGVGEHRLHRMNNPGSYVDDIEGIPLEQEDPEDDPLSIGDLILLMDSLSDKQRFVIELRYGFLKGVPLELTEISELMGISFQAVARLEQRALDRMRKRLNEMEGSDRGDGSPVKADHPHTDSPGAESTLTGDAGGC